MDGCLLADLSCLATPRVILVDSAICALQGSRGSATSIVNISADLSGGVLFDPKHGLPAGTPSASMGTNRPCLHGRKHLVGQPNANRVPPPIKKSVPLMERRWWRGMVRRARRRRSTSASPSSCRWCRARPPARPPARCRRRCHPKKNNEATTTRYFLSILTCPRDDARQSARWCCMPK